MEKSIEQAFEKQGILALPTFFSSNTLYVPKTTPIGKLASALADIDDAGFDHETEVLGNEIRYTFTARK